MLVDIKKSIPLRVYFLFSWRFLKVNEFSDETQAKIYPD